MNTITFRSPLVLFLVVVAALATSVAAGAEKPFVNVGSSGDLAIKGFDVVAYQTEGRPVPGRAELEHTWNGARWRFSSPENRDRFVASPDKYAPQFGGYCAYAVSRGYTADVDPKAWKVVDGLLYLNYSVRVQRLWEQDVPGNIAKGRQNWPAALRK